MVFNWPGIGIGGSTLLAKSCLSTLNTMAILCFKESQVEVSKL